jgi:IS30 family transposase
MEEINEMMRLAMQKLTVREIAAKIGRSHQAVYRQFQVFKIPADVKYRNPTQIFNKISTGYVEPPYSQNTFNTLLATVEGLINDMQEVKQNIVWAIQQTEILKEEK